MKYATVAVLLLATLCLAADTPQGDIPAKAILPTRRYTAALEQAKARYDREVEQARREYVRELERAKAEYMEAKDLAGATAVQGLADDVAAASPVATSFEPGSRWGLNGDASVWIEFSADGSIKTFTGRDAGVWTLRPDGTVTAAYGPDIRSMTHDFTFLGDSRAASRQPGTAERSWVRVK